MTTHTSADAPRMTEATPALQRRLMAVLFTSQSIFNGASSVTFPMLPIVAVALTSNELLAGVPATITLIARTLVAWPIGWLMDKVGRRLGISLGISASVFGLLLSAYGIINGSFLIFCAGAFLNGLGRGTGEQSRYAAADIVPPERAASAIALVVFAGTIGSVLGPFLITPSQNLAQSRALAALSGPYFLAAMLSIVSLALIFLLLRPDPAGLSRHRDAQMPDVLHPARSLREIFSVPTVQLAVTTLAISQLVMTMIMVITPLHMSHSNHSTQAIELVIVAHILGMFGLSTVTGRLVKRFGSFVMIAVAGVVLALSTILAPLADSVWALALALFILGLGWNFGFVAGSALLAQAFTGPEKGQTQGAAETLVAGAAALGSFSIGPAFQWGGMVAVSMLGLSFVLILMGTLFVRRHAAMEDLAAQ